MAAPIRSHVLSRVVGRLLRHNGDLKRAMITKTVPSWSFHRFIRRKYCMKSTRNLFSLHDRGIFQAVFPTSSAPELEKKMIEGPLTVYCGFDPTADSLHIGNLLAIVALIHCQRGGHTPLCLIGGATARIGDPSGKTSARSEVEVTSVERNVTSIHESIQRIFHNHFKYIWKQKKDLPLMKIINNKEWYKNQNVIEFLSSVGRRFKMNDLLSRHSVKSRLQTGTGMCFTEFTYQVFQAYDWLYLLQNYECTVQTSYMTPLTLTRMESTRVQIGGGDQHGNIVTGYDFIRSVTKERVYGLTLPLIITASGHKLGKTEGNAVWLNSDKTSAFHLYQYFINLRDTEVKQYLKLFTFLSEGEIEAVMKRQQESPEGRPAQRKLAEQVTLLVHGEDGVKRAKIATEALYHRNLENLAMLNMNELEDIFSEALTVRVIWRPGMTALELCMKAKCFKTETDAVQVIEHGGLYINYCQTRVPEFVLTHGQHILPNNITLIRIGKKNYYIVKWDS